MRGTADLKTRGLTDVVRHVRSIIMGMAAIRNLRNQRLRDQVSQERRISAMRSATPLRQYFPMG